MRIFCEAGGFAQQTDHWFCMLYYVNLKLRLKPLMAAKTQLALVKGQNTMLGLRTHCQLPILIYLQQSRVLYPIGSNSNNAFSSRPIRIYEHVC